MLCFVHRLEGDVQISLLVDLRDGEIQRSLTEIRPGRQGRFPDNVAVRILYRLQTEHRAELFECNVRGLSWEAVFRPGVQADGILATESDRGRFLLKIIKQTFFAFQPGAFKARAERQVNFLSFSTHHLHGIDPAYVARDRPGIEDLLDLQAIVGHQA